MKIFISTIFFLSALTIQSPAQELSPALKDSIEGHPVIKAMSDEIERNLSSLQEDGYSKPFFIGYDVSDLKFSYSMSMLGAVINSNSTESRSWSARVIVGDYKINDENFENSFKSYTFDPGYANLPIENDYWGIRRVFWIATNNIYKSAARNYKQKIQNLEEYNQEYLLPDFSKEEPILYYDTSSIYQPKKDEIDILTRNISAEFKNYPEFLNSAVIGYNVSAKNYFSNSEGTKMIVPMSMSSLMIQLSKGVENMMQSGTLVYHHDLFEKLPKEETIKGDIQKMIVNISELDSLDEYKEDYSGPLMLKGQAVAEFFIANLLVSGENGLIASRERMVNSTKQDFEKHFRDLKKELEENKEKKIAVSSMQVEALPFLSEYEGTRLIGAFDIDGEGVVPDEQLTMIKDGALETKLNDRVPTAGIENSNGYNRFYMINGQVSKTISPGVLKVSFSNSTSLDSLEILLKNEAKEDELTHGLYAESLELTSMSKPIIIFRKNLENGNVEPLNGSPLRLNRKNILKKIVGVSNTYRAYNLVWSGNAGSVGMGSFGGVPISIIVPEAVVIKDFDYTSYKVEQIEEESIIKGPFQQ